MIDSFSLSEGLEMIDKIKRREQEIKLLKDILDNNEIVLNRLLDHICTENDACYFAQYTKQEKEIKELKDQYDREHKLVSDYAEQIIGLKKQKDIAREHLESITVITDYLANREACRGLALMDGEKWEVDHYRTVFTTPLEEIKELGEQRGNYERRLTLAREMIIDKNELLRKAREVILDADEPRMYCKEADDMLQEFLEETKDI